MLAFNITRLAAVTTHAARVNADWFGDHWRRLGMTKRQRTADCSRSATLLLQKQASKGLLWLPARGHLSLVVTGGINATNAETTSLQYVCGSIAWKRSHWRKRAVDLDRSPFGVRSSSSPAVPCLHEVGLCACLRCPTYEVHHYWLRQCRPSRRLRGGAYCRFEGAVLVLERLLCLVFVFSAIRSTTTRQQLRLFSGVHLMAGRSVTLHVGNVPCVTMQSGLLPMVSPRGESRRTMR